MEIRADLHIHSVLSPCADLSMSPRAIVQTALAKKLNVIAVTDHNSTLQLPVLQKLANDNGLMVLLGAEITTREEVHTLIYVPGEYERIELQHYIKYHLPEIFNHPEIFGDQVVVNEYDEIVYEENCMLLSALNVSIDELITFARSLNAIVIPAHADKRKFSIFSQLGFVSPDMDVDGLEVFTAANKQEFYQTHPELKHFELLFNSDAHHLEQIGSKYNIFNVDNLSFSNIQQAIKKTETNP
jgi:PHP family Zn ribbon phosphoesterase